MKKQDIEIYIAGILNRDRRTLAKTITLIESSLPSDREAARRILEAIVPHTGKSLRVGITGTPGAGKSTFIESFGTMLTEKGYDVAVLAVDPSSPKTGGSILADKTRMCRLAVNEKAFIRPSPSKTTPGGVARKTREALLVCEAAGFGVVIVETVGVGQSEYSVASMVDFFLVLMVAGGGDELQGIKKGILELADAIAVNKADGDNIVRANRTRQDFATAIHLLTAPGSVWTPPVVTCSAITMDGMEDIFKIILEHQKALTKSGEWEKKRRRQSRDWVSFLVQEGLEEWFRQSPAAEIMPSFLEEVEKGNMNPTEAAAKILSHLKGQKF